MRFVIGFLFCVAVLCGGSVRAQDVDWVGGTTSFENDFHTAANWMPAIVPGATERAIITGTVFPPTITSDVTLLGFVITSDVSNQGFLTIDGADVVCTMVSEVNAGDMMSSVVLSNNGTLSVDTLVINPSLSAHANVDIGSGSTVTVTGTCNVGGSASHSGRILGLGTFVINPSVLMTCGTTAGQPAIFSNALTQVMGTLRAAQSEINIGGGLTVNMDVFGLIEASGGSVFVQNSSTLRPTSGGQLRSIGSNRFHFAAACTLDIHETQTLNTILLTTSAASGTPALLQGTANPLFSGSSNVVIESSNVAGGFMRVNQSGLVMAGSMLLDSENSNNNISLEIPNSSNFQIAGVLELNGDTSDQSSVIGAGALIVNSGGTLRFNGNSGVQTILTCNGALEVNLGQSTITQSLALSGVSATMTVEIAGQIGVNGGMTVTDGTATVDGILNAPTVMLSDGTLEGTGSVNADVTNAGKVRPGRAASTGSLVISGTYTQVPLQGILELDLAGILDYDQLITNNTTSISHEVIFTLLGGYVPANNMLFNSVVEAQSSTLTGTFTVVTQDAMSPTVTLTPEYTANSVNLRATVGTLPGTPSVTGVTASRTLARTDVVITFAVTATEPGGLPLTYTWDFKDGNSSSGNPVTHAFAQGGVFLVQVTASNGTNSAQGTVSVEILAPNSGGVGETNVGQGKPAVTNPLNGIALAVQSSNGGVVELAVDVDALNRDEFDLLTSFDGFQGRKTARVGPRPTDKFTEPSVAVATTTATDVGTTNERGKARRQIAVSSREVGLPVAFTTLPADRSVKLDSMKGKFLFSDSKPDQFTFTGRIELPEGLDLSQARTLELAIGNLLDRVDLDAKGKTRAKGSLNRIVKAQVKYPKLAKGSTLTRAGQEAKITLTMKGVNFSEQGFDTEGIVATLRTDEAGMKSVPRSIQASILFGGATWEAPIPVEFKLTKNADSGTFQGRGTAR